MTNPSSRTAPRGQLLPLPRRPWFFIGLYFRAEWGPTTWHEKILEAERAGIPATRAISRLAQAICTRN